MIRADTAGRAVAADGHVRTEGGRSVGLSGVLPGGLAGLDAAFARHGRDLSLHCPGQYSAAAATGATGAGEVVLVQSSLGLGRAYWHLGAAGAVVGSDLLAVVRAVGDTRLDAEYFARYLALRPVGDRTPFAAVRQLHGGATAVLRDGRITLHRPWRPAPDAFEGDPRDRLEALLAEAIAALVPDDAVVAADISGGTDSSLVAALCTRMGRRLSGITHVARRGMRGGDRDFARLVAARLGIPLTEFDGDAPGLTTDLRVLPDQPGGCRYRDLAERVGAHVRTLGARRYVTGVGGDVVFDYRGLVPAFLADPVVALRPVAAWRCARIHARERGGHRGAAHYLRHVGVPVAVAHLRGRNLADPFEPDLPDWLPRPVAAATAATRAAGIWRPSARYLWDAVFDLAAGENAAPVLDPETETVHPLLHRPLVAFLLGLSPERRRGIGGDRALQRALLKRLGLPEIAARRDKGSSQPLREMHLGEAERLLAALDRGALVDRGWVIPQAWSRAVDQAAVGASPHAAFFGAAVECELWLRRFAVDGARP